MAQDKQEKDLVKKCGTLLYRLSEHYGRYSQAREILNRLIDIHRGEGDLHGHGVVANNCAFEYLLEGRYQEAMPGFEEAARLFEDARDPLQSANARANWWICRYECGNLPEISTIEAKLKELADLLSGSGYWQARKPLVLLARLAEKRQEINEAIGFMKRAIQAGTGSGTRYPNEDAEYLHRLESRQALLGAAGAVLLQ
jgi:tetratricopeptide (TPR) repeat protein